MRSTLCRAERYRNAIIPCKRVRILSGALFTLQEFPRKVKKVPPAMRTGPYKFLINELYVLHMLYEVLRVLYDCLVLQSILHKSS